MNSTIDYYNNNADEYFQTTIGADLDEARKRFAAYLPTDASIIDVGCGSGRDVLAFSKMGFNAVGLDASEVLTKLASEKLGIKAFTADMSSWIAEKPYDGIWCCAALLHLSDEQCKSFFLNLKYNLTLGGVIFVSVKSGVENGEDKTGRFMRNFTEKDIWELADLAGELEIREHWYTGDALSRSNFRWLNVIMIRNKQ